jgi:tetratricopeptide (TPR) repeat protein
VVGASDDYVLETVRHLLSQNIKYHVFDCNELSRSEALRIYQKIPDGIKKPQFTFKAEEDDKYSFLEFTACNIRDAHTKRHVMDIFDRLYKKDLDSFKIITLAAYLSEHGSAMSYQNVAHMLDIPVFPDALNKTTRALNYLRQFNVDYEEEGQDYYVLRSKIFAYNARQVLLEKYRDVFGEIVKRLALKESIYSILRYDIFRRKSFDSGLFHQLFSYDEAVSIYKAMYEMDKNPYILQQLALCRGLFGDYANAFADIDKAVNSKPYNFSFKNSQAILLFESNHHSYADGSVSYMVQAMSMLEECYNNDKRKLYHAQKYAEFAIIMFENYGNDNYLSKAQVWLLEMIDSGASESYKTKNLLEKITNILSKRALV